jgi:hypothetical protein
MVSTPRDNETELLGDVQTVDVRIVAGKGANMNQLLGQLDLLAELPYPNSCVFRAYIARDRSDEKRRDRRAGRIG